MRKIAMIVKDIKDELEGAEHYAKMAAQYKDEDKALADAYAEMASQELSHVDKLHAQVVRVIKEYRDAGNKPPEAMMAVWDWEHEDMVSHTAKIKILLEMYRK